jgi:hypothetical protein
VEVGGDNISYKWFEVTVDPAGDQAKAGRNTGMGLMVETAQRQVESKL